MTREAREMKEIIQETKETTRDEGDEGDDRDNEGDDRDNEGDDRDNEGDEVKAKRDDGDDGKTQEMKTTMEEGRIAPSMRADEGREQTASIQDDEGREESHFNVYLYLIQDIYMETKPSTATRVGESEAELAT